MRKLRRMGVTGGAALLAAALVMPAGIAHADTQTVTDQYGAAASAEVLDLHLLGRHVAFGQAQVNSLLDAVTNQLTAEAKGLGTLLVPASQAVARFNDPASVNKACALPDVANVTGLLSGTAGGLKLPVLDSLGGLSLGSLLPKIDINVGCAEANVAGSAQSFLAESVGGLLRIHVGLPQAISDAVGTVRSTVNGVLGTGGLPVVGGLLGNAAPTAAVTDTLGSVNGLLGGILGNTKLPIVGDVLDLDSLAPALKPQETVDGLLAGLENGDLVTIDLGVSTARNAGDLQSYLSQAVSEGGAIAVLPNFLGADKPLLKIEIMKSLAKVNIDRNAMKPVAEAKNTLIRIESALLPDLGLASVPIVGDLLSTGLPVVGQIAGVTNGLLGGVPVVNNLLGFDATIKSLGLSSGAGFIELGPGMSVSLLCDGIVAPLCTEISVGAVQDPVVMPNGRTRIESSAATIHLLKGLNNLGIEGLPVLSNLNLGIGTILGNGLLGGVLDPIIGATGLSLGEASDVPGIKISLAHAMAEAGGNKVLGATEERARELAPVAAAPVAAPALPRTGGLPVDATAIPVLLGASAGLRALVRRRRRNV